MYTSLRLSPLENSTCVGDCFVLCLPCSEDVLLVSLLSGIMTMDMVYRAACRSEVIPGTLSLRAKRYLRPLIAETSLRLDFLLKKLQMCEYK